jgi:hypothetical protein
MAFTCDVSSDCAGVPCIEHRCISPEELAREREAKHAAIFDPVRKRYVGATFAPFASGGVEGRNVQALGGDLFFGVRLERWFSLEGFYTYDFALNRSPFPAAGVMCPQVPNQTWFGEWFRWQTLGVRAWFHIVHLTTFDFSAAPFVSGGFEIDHTAGCGTSNRVTNGPVVELGTAFAIEVRPAEWLGIRLSAEALIDFGVSVAAVRGSLGPVIRF